jgi:S-disulfanyl-L-cysteine oxidoreductase SoxD
MYPYAPILFDYVRRAMPMDRPLTMSPNEVYAVAAYLLHLNGLVPEDAVMDQDSLPGFVLDDRPDTRAGRCMKDCK